MSDETNQFTIRMPDAMHEWTERKVREGDFQNRSEVVREAVRRLKLEYEAADKPDRYRWRDRDMGAEEIPE